MIQMGSKYPEQMVQPMREELTSAGVRELRTAEEVSQAIEQEQGTTLVVINSVCGCAAGSARPAVKIAIQNDVLPNRLTTVFAGVDAEAVAKARSFIQGYPPSSPSVALFKDGKQVFMLPRHQIEGRMPEEIANDLKQAFNTYCNS